MKRSLPIRRSVAVYAAACILVLLTGAPVYGTVAGAQGSAEACGCCAHSYALAGAACCAATHPPAPLPALPSAAWQFVLIAATACCMVLSALTTLGPQSAKIRTGSPPGDFLTPLRI